MSIKCKQICNITVYEVVDRISMALLCIYSVLCYLANDVFLPSVLRSIFLYLCAAFGLVCVLLNSRIFTKHLFWYMCFMTISLIGVLYTDGDDWWSVLYTMIVNLVICIVITQLITTEMRIKVLFSSLGFGATVLTLYLFLTNQLYVDERLGTTLYGNPNTFAFLYMFAAICITWLMITVVSKKQKVFWLICLILNFYPLLLSGGRKYVVVPILFLYIILLMKRDSKGKRHVLFKTAVVLLIVFVVYYLMMTVEVLYDAVGYRMQYLINYFTGEGKVDASNEIREKMRNLAFDEGFSQPIFGHGFDSFKYLSGDKINYYAYSHNNWTEIWYNLGLFGMIVYYSYYLYCFVASKKRIKSNFNLASFGIAFILSMIVFEYGCVTYYETQMQMLLCVVGVMMIICDEERTYEQA